jgi:hypothetical protein
MAELGGGRSFVATPFRTLYTFHSMSPLILRPNWQVEAVRPRSLCLGLGLLLEAAMRTHLTGIPYPKQQRRKMATHSSLTPAMFASIVSIVYRTVFLSHHIVRLSAA